MSLGCLFIFYFLYKWPFFCSHSPQMNEFSCEDEKFVFFSLFSLVCFIFIHLYADSFQINGMEFREDSKLDQGYFRCWEVFLQKYIRKKIKLFWLASMQLFFLSLFLFIPSRKYRRRIQIGKKIAADIECFHVQALRNLQTCLWYSQTAYTIQNQNQQNAPYLQRFFCLFGLPFIHFFCVRL